jgi:hypothetical protein
MKDTKEESGRITGLLRAKLTRYAPLPGKIPTAVEGLYFYRHEMNLRTDSFHNPVIGVIAQGEKRTLAADREYCFREGWYIVHGVDLPAISHILGASAETPHLALSIPLDYYL